MTIALAMLQRTGVAVPAIVYSLLVYASASVAVAWGRRRLA